MKNEELADKMVNRIFDLKEQIDHKNKEVAALAANNKRFDIGRIQQLCDQVNIICCQIEILQEFVDLQFGADITTLSDEQLN